MVALTQESKWLEVRIDFEMGKFDSLKELAERHNVSYPALRKRAERELWKEKASQLSQKVQEKVLSKADLWVNQTVERGFRYRSDIDSTRNQCGTDAQGNALLEPTDIRTLAQAESVIDSMARRSLGLSERIDVTSGGVDLGTSFVAAIQKMRDTPNLPRLTDSDLKDVMSADIVD